MNDIFLTKTGKKVFSAAIRAIDEYGMQKQLRKGVLVGLSGGADSVMLLLLLLKIKSSICDFPIIAVHINHMIRGDEADRDEKFSENLCKELNVNFKSVRINIPQIAKETGAGIEEAARNARYAAFNQIIEAEDSIKTIAVAHNATDNLETVIFNMMRGTGISGMAGIPPIRDNIVRPLIYSSKSDIVDALNESSMHYVTDSTNADTEYSRNYIRSEIIPRLYALNNDAELMATRMCRNIREDSQYISDQADLIIYENLREGYISKKVLATLPKSMFYRVMLKMIEPMTPIKPERTHVDAIFKLLDGGNFSYSLPGKIRFVAENGLCHIGKDILDTCVDYCVKLGYGVNKIPGYSTVAIVSADKNFESYLNIYKISIQTQIPSDIIDNGLFVRSKEDGDSYIFGGITRKLKKLFNDRKIPPSLRQHIPVVADNNGIVWVPGFKVRDGLSLNNSAYIAFAEPISINNDEKSIYFKAEYRFFD